MTVYLDTSTLVAFLTREVATQRVQAWMKANSDSAFAVTHWVAVEFSSAIAIKARTGEISLDDRSRILAQFKQMYAASLAILPVLSSHFRLATGFADRYDLGVRAGDALHLAVAADHGMSLATLDKTQAQAGLMLGIETRLL